jgi:D-xylose 1-dehydrogenase (NADP+, D-xylono-1,5-lactone-forming)
LVNQKIRWGVLSTANIGRAAVIPAIQASHNGELVAVASRDLEKGEAFAGRNGIPRAYGSYEALLEAGDIDAVYIPLPNTLHREWTIRAAELGKHILCEKPLAMNAAECLEMEAAASQHGVKLMEAFMYRFHPRTEKVLDMLRAGALGELRLIHSAFTFKVTRPENIRLSLELGGGALMDVGCYCVNISRTAAGAEPVEVQSYASWAKSGVDEQIAGTLRFANGLLAQFDCALNLERREEYQLSGTDAALSVDSAFLPGKGDVVIEEVRSRGEVKRHTVSGVDEYQLMVEHFADCILHDQAPRYPASEAAANMRVIEALYRSARQTGRPVALQDLANPA